MYVQLPESVESIGSRAFADCNNLRCIYIPEKTTRVSNNAFENNQNLTIWGAEGSYVEFYAGKMGYVFKIIG